MSQDSIISGVNGRIRPLRSSKSVNWSFYSLFSFLKTVPRGDWLDVPLFCFIFLSREDVTLEQKMFHTLDGQWDYDIDNSTRLRVSTFPEVHRERGRGVGTACSSQREGPIRTTCSWSGVRGPMWKTCPPECVSLYVLDLTGLLFVSRRF